MSEFHLLAARKTVLENNILYKEWQQLIKEMPDHHAIMNLYLRYLSRNLYFETKYLENLKLYATTEHNYMST